VGQVDVKEAAEALNISRDAVRGRLRRGTLEGEKVDGRWRVNLPEDLEADRPRQDSDRITDTTRQDADRTDLEALVKSQQEQIAFLRQQLEAREEEIRRRDHILNNLTRRLPEPADQDPGPEPEGEAGTRGLLQRIREWLRR